MAKKGGQKAQAPTYGGGYGSQMSAMTPQGRNSKFSGQAMQAPQYGRTQSQATPQQVAPQQGSNQYSSIAANAAASAPQQQQQSDGLGMTGGQLDPNYNNNQFGPSAPNMFAGGSSSFDEGAVSNNQSAAFDQAIKQGSMNQQAGPNRAPPVNKKPPVRADLYNAMHPYAQKLQGDAQGMANVPQQTSSWRDIKVAPGDKEAFARRRAAQEAEYKATHTIVPGKGGMSVSYNNANYTDPRIANMAYMSSTLRGQAPGMGTSVPGSDRSMNFKGR